MRGFSPVVPPNDPRICQPWLNRELRRISAQIVGQTAGLNAIVRGEVPDGSGTQLLDLTNFFFKPGIIGGQLAYGDTLPNGTLRLSSTSSPTKGFIYLGALSAFDEGNTRLGIYTITPAARLHLESPPGAQHLRPSVVTANSGIPWVDQTGSSVGADIVAAINETSPDDATYMRHARNGGTIVLTLSAGTSPGVTTGHVLRIRTRVSVDDGNPNDHLVIDMYNSNGSDEVFTGKKCGLSQASGPFIPGDFTPTGDEISTSFATFEYTLSALEVAAITSYTGLRINVAYYTGFSATTFVDVSWIELQLPGGTDPLQRWSENVTDYVSNLIFASDGASSKQLNLYGTPAYFISVGDATSGLRFITASSSARIEAGTTGRAAMNLVLSGNRAVQGTLLTLDFANVRLTNTIEIRGGSPAAGKILTSTDSNGLATWNGGAALATREVTRWVVNGFYFVDTNWDGAFIVPTAMTISSAVLWRRVAGSSGTTEINILKNGVSIFTVKPFVTSASGANATASGTLGAGASCVAGDRLTLDITQAEVDGEDLSVTIEGA